MGCLYWILHRDKLLKGLAGNEVFAGNSPAKWLNSFVLQANLAWLL
jgi:hypothetical protein